ncbi:DedA family protein [Chondromyces apiculatus]|uniref:DedA family protein n=1 Tax=Chondromyces apiculatus DSM 436 TaxID=1192034 RepID=A0A017SWX9_9BACT|nr:DedA family protein [Chondromyces apiculatus]EYF01469.1 DedA family protein [Chondromyces apiculatus DSM 436]
MSLEHLLGMYGYWAVLLGTLLEGETILVLAGFAAHRGYLSLPLVMLAAFVGSLVGDQTYYWIGRRRGSAWLRNRPRWQARAEAVRRRLEQHPVAMILGFRFVYGVRTVSPFVIGASGVPAARFTPLNAVGAALWAALVGGFGYLFGEMAERVLGELRCYEGWLFGGLLLVGVVVWLVRRIRAARSAAPPADKSTTG